MTDHKLKKILNSNIKSTKNKSGKMAGLLLNEEIGFTLIEVLTAMAIMIILCVGILSVFSYVIKLNQGNNLRSQALTVLQIEAELYRSYKFVPGAGLSDAALTAGTYTRPQRTSEDGTVFDITVTVDNNPSTTNIDTTPNETTCTFKEIIITAVPSNPRTGWLANLQTRLVIERVRSN